MPKPSKHLACERCPRLVALRHVIAESHPTYHAAPVAAWGARRARLLIVGLAPGMHGANKTGRPFTGDASGRFLFEALHRAGFASTPTAESAALIGCRITNAVKCLPPNNKPIASELKACRSFLANEMMALTPASPRRPRCILALGRVAYESVGKALDIRLPVFGHAAEYAVNENLHVIASYHPSRQNVNTRRLNAAMLDAVLGRARDLLDGGKLALRRA
ncbi:MAG: uracil-DNA glycosylase [Gammaproteobacteria bacterium]|nr:uracil-DNA glycosylase [Gammaproteobacteria bacterium]